MSSAFIAIEEGMIFVFHKICKQSVLFILSDGSPLPAV